MAAVFVVFLIVSDGSIYTPTSPSSNRWTKIPPDETRHRYKKIFPPRRQTWNRPCLNQLNPIILPLCHGGDLNHSHSRKVSRYSVLFVRHNGDMVAQLKPHFGRNEARSNFPHVPVFFRASNSYISKHQDLSELNRTISETLLGGNRRYCHARSSNGEMSIWAPLLHESAWLRSSLYKGAEIFHATIVVSKCFRVCGEQFVKDASIPSMSAGRHSNTAIGLCVALIHPRVPHCTGCRNAAQEATVLPRLIHLKVGAQQFLLVSTTLRHPQINPERPKKMTWSVLLILFVAKASQTHEKVAKNHLLQCLDLAFSGS